jgi:hypothetical protein
MSDYLEKLGTAVKNIFLAPVGLHGIDGFEFSVLRDRSLTLDSEITDYPIENNSRVQDHISLMPIMLELSGFVGESVEHESRLGNNMGKIASRLTQISSFFPVLSEQAQEYFDEFLETKKKLSYYGEKISSGVGFLRDVLASLAGDTNIQKAYRVLSSCWYEKIPLVVKTDFADFENMFIKTIKFSTNSDEKYKSDIAVTLKQITSTSRQTTTLEGRLVSQKAETINYGEAGKNSSVMVKIKDFLLLQNVGKDKK